MAESPSTLVRAANYGRSLAFYLRIGFEVEWERPDVAQVKPPVGRPVLLAGPEAGALTDYLAPVHSEAVPGKLLYFGGGTPEFYQSLRGKGLADLKWTEYDWGYSFITVPDPDGHIIYFGGGKQWSDVEMLHWYDQAADRLDEALAGLTEADLDLSRAPGKWTIRQIVLHIVDSDCTSLARVKFALAEPGRLYNGNGYNPDRWAEGLDYAHRPIGPEVALFKAIRGHIGGLVRHLEGALDRTTDMGNGQTMPVRPSLNALTVHALHHIEQIKETRRVHGV
ncbi:MAG: glyoxalase [Symbiobacteriaceae bacterium]|nr:glyoxalase [Symbiobacteriaceae bacterium]